MPKLINKIKELLNYFVDWRYIVKCSFLHFLLGFSVATLVYLLTATIFSHFSLNAEIPMLGYSINLYSLSLALCASVLSHVLEDWLFNKF